MSNILEREPDKSNTLAPLPRSFARRSFESVLFKTRVYGAAPSTRASIDTMRSTARMTRWTKLSDAALSEISNIAVFNLPVAMADITAHEAFLKPADPVSQFALQMWNALLAGDVTRMKFLESLGAKLVRPAAEDPKTPVETPIFYALRIGNLELLEHLLSINEHPKEPDSDGYQPLHVALFGDIENKLEVCKLLLANGADFSDIDALLYGSTNLTFSWLTFHKCVHDRLTQQTLNFSFHLSDLSQPLNFQIHNALQRLTTLTTPTTPEDIAIRTLLAMSSSSPTLDPLAAILTRGWGAVHFAAQCHTPNLLRLLSRNGALDTNQYTASLLSPPRTGTHMSVTPLMIACYAGARENVKWLLTHGADPEFRTKDGKWTAAHAAALGGHTQIVRACIALSELSAREIGQMREGLDDPEWGRQFREGLEWSEIPADATVVSEGDFAIYLMSHWLMLLRELLRQRP
ncbi:ankyrin [Ascodesmis nigricans]|uniref:Ankyrin n=1 Tax=Ascodesmis nigricans TaxID=341454 RepID=A0A4S2MP09_9PEZI|nr:ankyrin [Ascodesmis nigricans]